MRLQRNWFLQVSGGAGAQAVVNGIFGVRPHDNQTISFVPQYNQTMMAPNARLINYRYRGSAYSVEYNAPLTFSVLRDGKPVAGCAAVDFGRTCVCVSGGTCSVPW